MGTSIQAINDRVKGEAVFVASLMSELKKVIVGQQGMLDRLLVGLLSDGHILLEGVPGLAKTLAIKSLADSIRCQFQRIQFTPDLLPADLLGTLIYNQKDGVFVPKKGPIFTNLLLADEINRAPAKVQSALLESMQERQVTIGDTTYPLPEPFLVMATQNPIEQEGTYPLPEAQVDRFMLKLRVEYPSRDEERQILDRMSTSVTPNTAEVVSGEDIMRARSVVDEVYMDERIKEYLLSLVFATREPKSYKLDIGPLIDYGASPRATLFLAKAARAHAFIQSRGFVTPEDVKAIGPDVLRHRVILSYEAEAENIRAEEIVQRIFDAVEVP